MTNELVPRWDVKGSVVIIKNSLNTELFTTTELDKFLYNLGDEGLNLFFQQIPNETTHPSQGNRDPMYPLHNTGLRSNLINTL